MSSYNPMHCVFGMVWHGVHMFMFFAVCFHDVQLFKVLET